MIGWNAHACSTACLDTQTMDEREREREVQDKGTSTSSWNSSHQQSGVEDKVKNTMTTMLRTSSDTSGYYWALPEISPPGTVFNFKRRWQLSTISGRGLNYSVLVPCIFHENLADRWSCNTKCFLRICREKSRVLKVKNTGSVVPRVSQLTGRPSSMHNIQTGKLWKQ